MVGRHWLEDVVSRYRRAQDNAERAAAQVDDSAFFATLGAQPNSIAVLMKHLGGNHRSRWRDFLTTDGEKSDRARDSEFVVDGESRAAVMAVWDEGWSIALASLEALQPDDLERTVTVRGQPHSVVQAIGRNLDHAMYHCGQIVLLARAGAGESWQTLSIAPGQSEAFNASMRARFGDWSTPSEPPASGHDADR